MKKKNQIGFVFVVVALIIIKGLESTGYISFVPDSSAAVPQKWVSYILQECTEAPCLTKGESFLVKDGAGTVTMYWVGNRILGSKTPVSGPIYDYVDGNLVMVGQSTVYQTQLQKETQEYCVSLTLSAWGICALEEIFTQEIIWSLVR